MVSFCKFTGIEYFDMQSAYKICIRNAVVVALLLKSLLQNHPASGNYPKIGKSRQHNINFLCEFSTFEIKNKSL